MNNKKEFDARLTELEKLIIETNKLIDSLSGELDSDYVDDFTIRIQDEIDELLFRREELTKEYQLLKKHSS